MQNPVRDLNSPDVEITKFTDIHQYLSRVYLFRKANEEKFSYDSWAQELHIKSRSFLRLLLTGQRKMTLRSQNIFIQNLNLKGFDVEYFKILCDISNTENPVRQSESLRKLQEISNIKNKRLEIENLNHFLSSTKIPILQVLLGFDDNQKTPESLASLLSCSFEKVHEYLQILKSLGLAIDLPDGTWKALQSDFKISERLGSQQLQKYHAQVLQETSSAVALPTHTRRFRNLFVTLSEDDYEDFSKKIEQFIQKTILNYSASELRDKRVYQWQSSLVPVTQSLSTAHNKSTNEEINL